MHCPGSKSQVKRTYRDELVKILRTEKQDFGLSKDVTVHLWEKSRWVVAEHRLQGMEA